MADAIVDAGFDFVGKDGEICIENACGPPVNHTEAGDAASRANSTSTGWRRRAKDASLRRA